MTLSPVLIFVYNRPRHTRELIASLRTNKLAEESDLIIYSDHPRTTAQQEAVKEVREYIHTLTGFKSVTIIERERNYGLAASIMDGVTTQLSRYGRVIVLEDDLIVAPGFLRFMNDALEMYKDIPEVGHIQACDFTGNPALPDTFLIKWTGSWGWATWKRAWKFFNADGKELLKRLEENKLTYTFDFGGSYHYTRMLREQIAGKNNSWAIRWNASLFINNILSLNVGKTLVQNNGFDNSGTHCGTVDTYHTPLWEEELPVALISPIAENREARKIFRDYYKKNYSFRAKVIRRIKRTLKGDFSK
ncbi:MAG: glycosyltransferase [Bacteroides sp.]|nr:glycosyltransferase [Bacteroides sp.]